MQSGGGDHRQRMSGSGDRPFWRDLTAGLRRLDDEDRSRVPERRSSTGLSVAADGTALRHKNSRTGRAFTCQADRPNTGTPIGRSGAALRRWMATSEI
jgi:hypothetical protein